MTEMGDYIRSTAASFLAYAPTDKVVHRHCKTAYDAAIRGDQRHADRDYAGASAEFNLAHPHLTAAAHLAKQGISAIQGFTPADILNQEMGASHEEHETYTHQINEGLNNGR
jgi:hypothetical protein